MNFENRKISDPYTILTSLSDKTNLKRPNKCHDALSNFTIYYTWTNMKKSYKTINLKY